MMSCCPQSPAVQELTLLVQPTLLSAPVQRAAERGAGSQDCVPDGGVGRRAAVRRVGLQLHVGSSACGPGGAGVQTGFWRSHRFARWCLELLAVVPL